jgi:hypothetical protein
LRTRITAVDEVLARARVLTPVPAGDGQENT